jgi:hypothetical protein
MAHLYTLELSPEQDAQLLEFQEILEATSRADVIKRALGVVALLSRVKADGNKLAIVKSDTHEALEIINFEKPTPKQQLYVITYHLSGQEGLQTAGPYESTEVEKHAQDISTFEGVSNVQVAPVEHL